MPDNCGDLGSPEEPCRRAGAGERAVPARSWRTQMDPFGRLQVRHLILVTRFIINNLTDLCLKLPTFYPTFKMGLYGPFLDVPGGLDDPGVPLLTTIFRSFQRRTDDVPHTVRSEIRGRLSSGSSCGACAVGCWWCERIPLQERRLRHIRHTAEVTSAIGDVTYCTITS